VVDNHPGFNGRSPTERGDYRPTHSRRAWILTSGPLRENQPQGRRG
jgi:hypothetical protein